MKLSDKSPPASQRSEVGSTDGMDARREIKKLRKHLKDLVGACQQVIVALDAEMAKPSDMERGKRIAKITNFLEMEKDRAHHFGLGKPLRPKKQSASIAEVSDRIPIGKP